MHIGLYFGTFNPIHVGHLIVANYMTQEVGLDEVWFVVSPQSPFKREADLLPDHHRLQMVHLAIREHEKLRACDIEFELARPSFTISTLGALKEQHQDKSFSIIMGEDNLRSLHKWKNAEKILSEYRILVYARAEQSGVEDIGLEDMDPMLSSAQIDVFHAPMLWISSTYIRDAIRNHRDIRYLVPEPVANYISNNFLYEKETSK